MQIYNDLLAKKSKISVVGLGYVGMPLAVAFAKKLEVIGFDINSEKIQIYKNGIDPTNEVGNQEIRDTTVYFTSDERELKKARFHIIAVPTPVNNDHTPNLDPIIGASEIIGRNLTQGSIVVYESTVYPGCTEEVCIPILEKESGLKCGMDFKIGYSPERINPGDKVYRLENIKKIVSGIDIESRQEIAAVYNLVINVGVFEAGSIKVAEAAKVCENSQRDINIAFMNELSMMFDKMDIDTKDVIDAMNTKWNALKFCPGLVGGHCIGVDPFYIIYKAEQKGYHSTLISAGRRINDAVGAFVAEAAIKKLILASKIVKQSKVYILGLTFKENCPDIRNTKVIDIIERLKEYGIEVKGADPYVSKTDAERELNIELVEINEISDADCLILAVAHNEYKQIRLKEFGKLFKKADNSQDVIVDVKSILDKEEVLDAGYSYWRL